ncbi:MAG: Tad domain-containing protein [Nocardioides sp.]
MAILVALSLTAILVVAAMVIDFGLIRIDRQVDRSAADAATLAGLHGLNTGDGTPHPYVGVCTAIRYLKVNTARFSGVNESAGWSNGLGGATGNGCTDTTLRNTTCKPDKTSWAKWHWTGTSQGVTYDVTIESGYDFGVAANQWQEDALTATNGDNGDSVYAGCDQLAVTIAQSREPGFGSLATTSDLNTDIRSVGRIRAVPGDSAPAMLLLKRTGCPVLKTGSNGGGSFIHVEGAVAPNGKTQPGTIHADSDGSGCSGNIYGGLSANGIVAYAAPLSLTSPTTADPAKPGSITSVAAANGITGTVLRDSLSNVYGTSALNGTSGTKTEVLGRSLVTRRLVDERFFPGVKPAISGASSIFASGASGPPAGWSKFPTGVDPCKPTQTDINNLALSVTSKLYIDCNGKFVGANSNPTLTFSAGTIYFRGWVNPAASLRLQNAHHVYIGNHGDNADAVSLGTGAEFQVHTNGFTDTTGNCTTGQNAGKAVMFVRTGQFKETAGLLRMCRTTVMMLGGSTTGCVPALTGTAPNLLTPCGGGIGTGQFTQNGGGIDWTAPDTLDATTDTAGYPLPTATAAWHDVNGLEDLALWSESGTNSSTGFSMAGGGLFQVRGVFMVPNAGPFVISGGASLNLTNAQYVATSIELNGNTTNITMRVDPNAAVTLPDQGLVGLVR